MRFINRVVIELGNVFIQIYGSRLMLSRVYQEEGLIFLDVIVCHSKEKCVCIHLSYSERSRDRAISLYRGATRHVLTRVAKCIDVDGGIFENVLR
jgi:hypothetical protein